MNPNSYLRTEFFFNCICCQNISFLGCLLGLLSWLSGKESPANQETKAELLGWEDPLEKEMAAHSSIPAWEIPWTEEPGGLQSMGSQTVRHNLATDYFFTFQAAANHQNILFYYL